MESSKHPFDITSWLSRSLIDQLGNIGAEAGRAIQAKENNDLLRFEWAFFRMDELFRATISDRALRHTRRLHEVLRAREVTYSFLDGQNEYHETPASLERYWMEWGILANMERKRIREEKNISI